MRRPSACYHGIRCQPEFRTRPTGRCQPRVHVCPPADASKNYVLAPAADASQNYVLVTAAEVTTSACSPSGRCQQESRTRPSSRCQPRVPVFPVADATAFICMLSRPVPVCSLWSGVASPDPKLSSLNRAQDVRRIRRDCREPSLPNSGSLVEFGVQGVCTVHRNREETYAVLTVQQHPRSDLFSLYWAKTASVNTTPGPLLESHKCKKFLKLVCKANARNSKRANEMRVTVLFEPNRDMPACFCQCTGPRHIVDVPTTHMAIEKYMERRRDGHLSLARRVLNCSEWNHLHTQDHQMAVFFLVLSQHSWQNFGSETCESALLLWP